MAKILLIDICGTLYQSNTTFDMLRFYYEKRPLFRGIQSLRKIKIVGFLNYNIFRLFHVDIIRKLIIRYLKGNSKEKIRMMTEEFYRSYLLDRINEISFKIINNYREKGARLIIVSATMDCIANCVAQHNNIDEVLSSKLHYTGDVCDGYLYDDLLGTKLDHIEALKLNTPYDIITDNYSDSKLIENAEHSFLIQYKGKKNKWPGYIGSNTLKRCEILEIG